MSGDATFAGTTYQARIIAFVYVHILGQRRLGWLGVTDDDTPLAVSGEVGGPGDDARVEFGDRRDAIEVQAKHGLTGGAKLRESVVRVRDRTSPTKHIDVVLTIDRNSTKALYNGFARDLDRLRSGRIDGLGSEIMDLRAQLGVDIDETLRAIRVVPIDLDHAHDPEAKAAIDYLGSALEDPSQATAAWGLLAADAGDVCARRLRRDRRDIVKLLAASGIAVKPDRPDERWHRALDFSRHLLLKQQWTSALVVLRGVETDLDGVTVEPRVRYRLAQQRAMALLHLHRYAESLASIDRALDIDPVGVAALTTGALAAMLSGDLDRATRLAYRATTAEVDNPDAWGVQAQVDAAAGRPTQPPPLAVAASPQYQITLAQVALNGTDWDAALDLTAALLAEDNRSLDVLLIRSRALVQMPSSGSPLVDTERWREAERLTTDVVTAVQDESDTTTVQALVLRANARRLMQDSPGAQADLERARALAHDDPEVMGQVARARLDARDYGGALAALNEEQTERYPMLLAFRARARAAMKDIDGARADLTRALQDAEQVADVDTFRLLAAEVALELRDDGWAERILADVSPAGNANPYYAVVRARIAIIRGDFEVARVLYGEAAAFDPAGQGEYFAELGSSLRRAGRSAEAVEAFDQAGAALPAGALFSFAAALVESNALIRARALIDRLARDGPLPDWALGIAADVALRQEDTQAAAEYLAELVNRGKSPRRARIELTRRLIELDRLSDATPHLNALVGEPDLSPVERMQTAQLLRAAGRDDEALPVAYLAYRAAPSSADMHRAFIALSLTSKAEPQRVTETGPDTFVRLKGKGGEVREYSITTDAEPNSLQGEISLANAQAADLLHRRIGDEIVYNAGSWQEQRWTIEEILPLIEHAVHDAMLHFQERFPGEPPFITSFPIGDKGSVADLAPIVASLEGRTNVAEKLLAMYREHTLPLGFLARVLGLSIPEAITSLTEGDSPVPLVVEWVDATGRELSRDAAATSSKIILTRSGLHTAYTLGILDRLVPLWSITAPLALRGELRDELREADRLVAEGQRVMVKQGPTIRIVEREPDDPQLRRARDDISAQLEWLEQHVRLEARPLAAVERRDMRDDELRELIGKSSHDALALAERDDAGAFYADDLGLRQLLTPDSRAKSFSTLSLLMALVTRGALSKTDRDAKLVVLSQRRYVHLLPTGELLTFAVDHSATLDPATVRSVFALLGGATMTTAADAAQLIANVIRGSATAAVQVMTAKSIADAGLHAMSARWARPLCAMALLTAAARELALLPTYLQEVQDACAGFLRPYTG